MLHNQIWISISRYQNAKGNNLLVDKSLQFEQVDREQSWDDQIILSGIILYLVNTAVPGGSHLPIWRTDGVILAILLHAGPVEFLYYWLHRALHHHYLYSRYHSHHHSSIITEPITSVIHPFSELITYYMLFSITTMTLVLTGTASLASIVGYFTYVDFMNNMGHCNFEFIPKWLFSLFPPLKFLMYTPSPHTSKWYMWLMWPLTLLSTMLTWIYGRTFVVERNQFNMLTLQTWVIPKYSVQYFLRSHENSINDLIEQAILEAEKKGVKVLSLGLLNQGEELNGYGGVYVKRNPQLKIKVVDGSSLAAAIVLNSIPKGTTQVLLRGKITKVACAIAVDLCKQGIQVATLQQDEYMKISKSLEICSENSLILSKSYSQKNWLPRRVMSAWRIAGIVHALEGWNEHECGYTMSNMEKVWQASLQYGFQPLMFSNGSKY
nr:isoform 2 of protein cer1-like 1 [Quercus suber]